MAAGLVVRAWAARILGRFYTRTLRIAEDQPIIRRGPYRLVRHPGYAADLLLWLGLRLATRNALVAFAVSLAMRAVYAQLETCGSCSDPTGSMTTTGISRLVFCCIPS